MPLKDFTEQLKQWLNKSLDMELNVNYPWEILDKLEKNSIGIDSEVKGLLRDFVVIGKNCNIGQSSEIKNSIIMDYSNAPHHNYVGDSIIGKNCNLGAGTKIANFRLDGKEISIDVGCERYKTGRQKFGAILENRVKVGCNVVICPGSYIGENSYIGPGIVVYGYVPPNSRIKSDYRNRYD